VGQLAPSAPVDKKTEVVKAMLRAATDNIRRGNSYPQTSIYASHFQIQVLEAKPFLDEFTF
jgi:hypothetical protein